MLELNLIHASKRSQRSVSTLLLTVHDNRVFVFHNEAFQPLVPFQCVLRSGRNSNCIFISLKIDSIQPRSSAFMKIEV